MIIRAMLTLLVLFVLALLAAPCLANVHHNPPSSTWTGRKTLTWQDANREVRYVDVYVPTTFARDKSPLPVVMWFMGSRRNIRSDYHYLGLSYEDCGIAPYAEKNRFMLVVIDQKRLDGAGWECNDADTLDESLILDVLGYLKTTFPVDESRVYLWGISAGGKLSQFMAVKHPLVFTAVVSFSGVIDNLDGDYYKPLIKYLRESPRKFPVVHWQTEGDFEELIKNMKGCLRLYREAGYPVEFVWLSNPPGQMLKHEWYAELYNQKMWDWCKQFRLVNGETVVVDSSEK